MVNKKTVKYANVLKSAGKLVPVSTKLSTASGLKDGAKCKVVAGSHIGKTGTVKDINTSKTGHVTITVLQLGGERFKTLAKNIQIIK